MSCEADIKKWAEAAKPARLQWIECDEAFDNAWIEVDAKTIACKKDLGGGLVGGAAAGVALGGIPGALIGAGIGLFGGSLICQEGLRETDKSYRSAEACRQKYLLFLEDSKKEYNDMMRCILYALIPAPDPVVIPLPIVTPL